MLSGSKYTETLVTALFYVFLCYKFFIILCIDFIIKLEIAITILSRKIHGRGRYDSYYNNDNKVVTLPCSIGELYNDLDAEIIHLSQPEVINDVVPIHE